MCGIKKWSSQQSHHSHTSHFCISQLNNHRSAKVRFHTGDLLPVHFPKVPFNYIMYFQLLIWPKSFHGNLWRQQKLWIHFFIWKQWSDNRKREMEQRLLPWWLFPSLTGGSFYHVYPQRGILPCLISVDYSVCFLCWRHWSMSLRISPLGWSCLGGILKMQANTNADFLLKLPIGCDVFLWIRLRTNFFKKDLLSDNDISAVVQLFHPSKDATH